MDSNITQTFSDGDVRFWLEQGSSIHLRAATSKHGDPVELTSEEARKIAQALLAMADKLDCS